TESLEKFWEERWDWDLPTWFHRFDADHVKEHFIIILFEPDIKVDLALYTKDSLPPPEGAPFLLDYYKEQDLKTWCENSNKLFQEEQKKPEINLAEIIHDDERVWAWLFYSYVHIARGEYYAIAADFSWLRGIAEKWIAHFHYEMNFETRRLEFLFEIDDLENLGKLFPLPEKESLITACQILLTLLLELRGSIESQIPITWNTTPRCINKIRKFFDEIK
ncbi:MAG: hypothetical protein ACW991_09770, partial [Candidatus Hodarchaeales archaeon]